MDPLTHTMTGAVLGRSGLERRTPLAMATLLLAANAPDVDVFTYGWGTFFARAHRRGLTHGIPALIVWPFVVAAVILAWDRWVRRVRDPIADPARPRAVLVLAGMGVLTHPILDWMNTYGLRWLMPIRGEWSYGDALFIIDPWIWALLGGALFLTAGGRRRRRPDRSRRIARSALLAVGCYIVLMVASDLTATRAVRAEARARGVEPVGGVMVAPLPARPFTGDVVVEVESGYLLGRFDWLSSPRVRVDWSEPLLRREVRPAPEAPVADAAVDRVIDAASAVPEVEHFLVWARYPFWRLTRSGEDWIVEVGDARYPEGGRLGGPTVELDSAALPGPPP